MSGIQVPVLGELVPGGLEFGRSYLVEFEAQSLWYETSLTLTADAIENRTKTEYHTFLHDPREVREALRSLGADVAKSESQGLLRILDTFSVTTGLGRPEKPQRGPDAYQTRSVSAMEWGTEIERQIREGFPEEQKKWLHVDDATSVLIQYAEENTVTEKWRTRWIPYTRARELASILALVVDTGSQSFFRQFESFNDGIFDFRSQDDSGRIEQYARVRVVRGKVCDSSWHHIRLAENGRVILGPAHEKGGEIGIRGWLRGAKRD